MECEACGEQFSIPFGLEPTRFCDSCAQGIAETLSAFALSAAKREARKKEEAEAKMRLEKEEASRAAKTTWLYVTWSFYCSWIQGKILEREEQHGKHGQILFFRDGTQARVLSQYEEDWSELTPGRGIEPPIVEIEVERGSPEEAALLKARP